MKKLFNKDNFVITSLDGNAKRSSLIISAALIVFFALSSFTFMSFLYCFSDVVGSIVSGSADVAIHDAVRSVPVFLTFFETLWILFLVHALYRAESLELVAKKVKRCVITSMAFGAIIILYVIIGRIAGIYLKFTEGSPSALYPLDSVLYSLLFIAGGVIFLFFKDKLFPNFHLELTSRAPVVRKVRIVYCIFVTLWMLFTLFAFSGFVTGLFIIDLKPSHGYTFYGLATLLIYLVAGLSLPIWELYYNELKEDAKKECLLPFALVSLTVVLVAVILYFVSLGLNLDAPSNMGFGVFPVAFAASVNIATMLLVFTPLIASVVAVVKGLILKLKK